MVFSNYDNISEIPESWYKDFPEVWAQNLSKEQYVANIWEKNFTPILFGSLELGHTTVESKLFRKLYKHE